MALAVTSDDVANLHDEKDLISPTLRWRGHGESLHLGIVVIPLRPGGKCSNLLVRFVVVRSLLGLAGLI